MRVKPEKNTSLKKSILETEFRQKETESVIPIYPKFRLKIRC